MEFLADSLSSWGYYGIFLFLVIGCFGPPIPDEILLIGIGYLSFVGPFEFVRANLVVITGSLSGIILDYLVGRFFLYSVRLVKMQSPSRPASKMRRVQDWIKRFGPAIVVGTYFLPGLRHGVPVVAGMVKAPPAAFGVGAGIGAILWSTAYITLGYLLAGNGVDLSNLDYPSLYPAIPEGALMFSAVWLVKRKFPGKEKPPKASSSPNADMSPVL